MDAELWAQNYAVYETFRSIYDTQAEPKASKIVRELWEKAKESGYWINLPLFFEEMEKIATIENVEKVFDLSRKIAHENDVELRLPNLYPDAKERICPYVDKETAFVRADGIVTPCPEFAYKHLVYVNAHIKIVNPVTMGDLKNESITDIWNSEKYVGFREIRRKMPSNIPWCGDCPYSTSRCFFTETNSLDCYANEPGCNECLYSVNIAQCNI
jgi:MoaA/NifB/PqqE/SkfB family radical SAM enzyme